MRSYSLRECTNTIACFPRRTVSTALSNVTFVMMLDRCSRNDGARLTDREARRGKPSTHAAGAYLQCIVLRDADKRLRQRDGAERRVEVKQAPRRDAKEGCDVNVVWQRCRQADDADHRLARLDEAQRASDDGLYDGSALICEQMHFVDDE